MSELAPHVQADWSCWAFEQISQPAKQFFGKLQLLLVVSFMCLLSQIQPVLGVTIQYGVLFRLTQQLDDSSEGLALMLCGLR